MSSIDLFSPGSWSAFLFGSVIIFRYGRSKSCSLKILCPCNVCPLKNWPLIMCFFGRCYLFGGQNSSCSDVLYFIFLPVCLFVVVLRELLWAQKSSAVISQMERVVAVVSCFSLHPAFQRIEQSFNNLLATQISPSICWRGDGNHGLFLEVMFGPNRHDWMAHRWKVHLFFRAEGVRISLLFQNTVLEPLNQNYPHLLFVFFCDFKFLLGSLNGLVASTVPGEEAIPTG